MIVEALLDMIEAVLGFLVGLVPDWTPPGWVTDNAIGSALQWMASMVGPLAIWFPFGLFATVVGGVFLFHVAMDGLGLMLKLYGMIRGGGGKE